MEAARIINQYFPATLATRARMLSVVDPERTTVECRRMIYDDLVKSFEPDATSLKPLTVEGAADLINEHFDELPLYTRERILRAFNITRPAFDLDYTRLIVASEFRHTTRQDIVK